ncbi:cell division protein anillin-domain-containing protein [Xylariales sp. AK1849]|nr:cell division protein anillin-domain-containing protein [Xylariales sp. AK1849]
MASQQSVTQPLRISKNTPTMSPTKTSLPRPLSEIPVTEKRRNSPSWSQPSKKMTLQTDSSPFQSSPLDGTASPRLFWQNRNVNNQVENDMYGGRSGSPSPTRRSSIERLQKASRVKNSTMFAREQKQEYDPAHVPTIERPLAKVQGNAFGGTGLNGLRSSHTRGESQSNIPTLYSPSSTMTSPKPLHSLPRTPSKDQASPTKSSLSASRFTSSHDSQPLELSFENSFDDHELPQGKSLHRHMKSVTFDAAPPQINEYEMTTPDLSSIGSNSREGSYESEEDDEFGYDHYHHGEDGQVQDDSFDATLEDTNKTPVVGPDEWRQDHGERFERSPMSEGAISQAAPARPQHGRTDSSTSSGDHRPLPPLPGMDLEPTRPTSSNGLSATAERMLGTRRNLPSPPPASASKSEIQNIGNGKMSLEERLKLMMLSDETSPKQADQTAQKSFAEQQRERRMRRAGPRDRVGSPTPERDATPSEAGEEDDTVGDLSGLDIDYQLPSISRQSILQRVNGNKAFERESDYNFNSSPAPTSPERQTPTLYDPDMPIDSIEDSVLESVAEQSESSVIINGGDGEEDENEKSDVYDLYQRSEDDQSEAEHNARDEDTDSHYSDDVERDQPQQEQEDSVTTPRAATPTQENEIPNFSATLPQVNGGAKGSDFTRSFQSYMLPKPKEADALTHIESHKMVDARTYLRRPQTPERHLSKPEYDGSGWGEPEDEEEEPGTPESVIHHPVSDDEVEEEVMDEAFGTIEEEPLDSPAVPERVATIKASGSRLKTRPSATPSDLAAMREARRHVSREVVPEIPPIPQRHANRMSRDFDAEPAGDTAADDYMERHPSFKKRSLTLDLDLGLSLDQDFERVIEAQKVAFRELSFEQRFLAASNSPTRQASGNQVVVATDKTPGRIPGREQSEEAYLNANITGRKQRGYLMRQNTKVVTASDKHTEEIRDNTRSAGNSPVKQAARPQSWTVEPWNGKARQRSIKKRHAPSASMSGPVPPMPGQQSNANTALAPMAEEEAQPELATEECGERGRLFIKVMGVKDLDLPLPKNERTWFSLTLDNGVHCVTTAWLELARNAPVGQEFELVVPNDLEFQLTLNVKLERPEPQRLPASPTKMAKPKTSTFSRVFASPKKRKEMEARARADEEAFAQAQRDAANKGRNFAPTAWDLLSPLTAEDGSFARSYVCLKEHESRCYGRPYMAEITAFNEWATEEANFASSVKSKRGGASNSVVRRAPYKIGKLDVQLLFVPRPKGSADDDMPKSMNSCIRELKAAEERLSRNWEGPLSQQGGDCPYWRRRYFKLVGTKLTAYHEATRQPRATINLSNTKRLIDDRRQLTQPDTTGRGGKRRRSAFAEEEEGYMFVEEGFRIRFNNGEVIDFYADTPEDKEGWMKVLGDVVGREGDDDGAVGAGRKKWCELILKREEALRKRAEGRRVHSRTKSMNV